MKKHFFRAVFLCLVMFHIAAAQPIQRGIRVSYYVTDAQIDFINSHYDYLITPFLSADIREKITGPTLLLYRSIQGTWEGFDQFDWNFINANENMFCHSDSLIQDTATRIITIWGSWLMDGNDLVSSSIPDAMKHWVNYYAVTASGQVLSFGYDGLFIDSAGHRLGPGAVYGIMPWNYSDDSWRDGRYAALSFIKSYLPDNLVIFNGLHSDNGADSSLNLTDGGMWEDFAYDIDDGSYKGFNKWLAAINCLNENKDSSSLVLVVKKPGLIDDMQARIFSAASFLLVSNENTVLSLSDYSNNTSMQFYPEYDIDLGAPLGDFVITGDSLFVRYFEKGVTVVNPREVETGTFDTGNSYFEVVPVGGGIIDSTGYYDGHLTYELPGNPVIEIPPVSAVILMDTTAVGVDKHSAETKSFSVRKIFPNPAEEVINIWFGQPQNNCDYTITDISGQVIKREKIVKLSKQYKINISDIPAGIYILILTGNSGQLSRKIVVKG